MWEHVFRFESDKYKYKMKKLIILCGLTFIIASSVNRISAQGTTADYIRASKLHSELSPLIYHSNMSFAPVWLGAKHEFWYEDHTPDGNYFKLVDADKRESKVLFDIKKLAAALSSQENTDIKAKDMYLERTSLSQSADTLSFIHSGYNWQYYIPDNKLVNCGAIPKPKSVPYWNEADNENNYTDVVSPNGKYTAFVRNCNVCVRDNATGKEKTLSNDGAPGNYYSCYLLWSPDSKKIFDSRFRVVPKRYIYFVESSPTDQLQPKLQKREYAKAGDELPFHTPAIFDVESGKQLVASTDLCPSQFFLSMFKWNNDSSGVTMEYNERGHKTYRVLEMNAQTGGIRTLIEEKSKTFVNYNRHYRYDTSDGKYIIWMSQRDNYNHLYLYDRAKAKVVNQVTKGEWYVRDVQYVDEKKHRIYFSASGMNEGEDPYLVHYYYIGLDGKGLTALCPEKGEHHVVYSPDMKYMVDTYSTVEKVPVSVLRETEKGQVVMPLEKADITDLLKTGWHSPEVFHAPGRDGKTQMWGMIVRPTHLDATKKYPIIEYIYAGPGSAYTTKDFHSFYWNMTDLAELGFIVVQLDAMGTDFRTKSFEDICYKNLIDCGFPDRIAWIKAAASKYSYMDTTRVGIFGASAGGQESMAAVLYHPEFYKAAYSSCGCHDNRMDKMWWNEQWMGYPVDSSYVRCSNTVNAYRLTRPLMLVVGEMDDNVDPSTTYQVVNALIKANKNFDLLVIPGSNHTMGGDYGEHKRWDFFVKHLWGIDPPQWK